MSTPSILGIIPARYGSSRFPGKALADINGKTMIQRVSEQVQKAEAITECLVATDDERILNHVNGFGGKAVLTSGQHGSGTERCREALEKTNGNFDFVVNIQGDEPYIHPEQIDTLAASLKTEQTEIATLIKKIEDKEHLHSPHTVKVIFNQTGNAIYFSRTPLPYLRDKDQGQWLEHHTFYKHIGIYAYHTKTLKAITQLPESRLEQAEGLEQLRWLENGYTIRVAETQLESHGIDTPEDLEKLN